MTVKELKKALREMGVTPPHNAKKATLEKLYNDNQPVETVEMEVKETPKGRVYSGTFVTIESADDRVLECIINSIPYSGKVLKVPAEREKGIREVLEGAGYELK